MEHISFRPIIIRINPQVLHEHTLEPHLSWFVWSAVHAPKYVHHKFTMPLKYIVGKNGVFRGGWDLKSQPFTRRVEYKLMHDLSQNLPNFRKSLWYYNGQKAIESGGIFVHKDSVARNVQQLDQIFETKLVELILSFKLGGYQYGIGADLPEGMIGRGGNLIKTGHGTHRLAAAKLSGRSDLFPIKVVGVHRLWASRISKLSSDMKSDVFASELQKIEREYCTT